MKIKEGYVMCQVDNSFVICEQMKSFQKRIYLNYTEVFIWRLLKKDTSKEKILKAMLNEFDIDRKTAVLELRKFLGKLERKGILENDESIVNLTEPNMSRLKSMRKERGYTQKKMQAMTGIDQSDYSKIENGKRYLSFEQCRRIALALNTSMDYLAGLTDVKEPYPAGTSRPKEN